MRVLDLFSGIGGFSLGLERAGMKTIAFCEIDRYCRQVLAKHWPSVPIYDDIRKLKGKEFESVDLICGGYPCQPFSTAGKRAGAADDRHLWPEMYRIIKAIRPRWVIAENVAGHITMGLDAVLSDLESEGYTCWPFVIPACAVDAKHRRDRVWIVANTSFRRCGGKKSGKVEQQRRAETECRSETMADTSSQGLQGATRTGFGEIRGSKTTPEGSEFVRTNAAEWGNWPVEPGVGRVANGVSRRVDRLRSLGNAVVPQIPEIIGRAIMEIDTRRPAA